MSRFKSGVLNILTEDRNVNEGIACVTICHNESQIIEQFLEHYRSIGIRTFFIVDDSSTDGTRDILLDQRDVILFSPKSTSRFGTDLPLWRQDILDFFLDGKWATLPDIDEFLYYKQMPRPLSDVARNLDERSEEVLIGAMIDMYQNRPISDNKYSGERPLVEEFPFFDGQDEPPFGIRVVSQKRKHARRFPTPAVVIKGGVRDRLFFQERHFSWFQKWLLGRYAHSRRPLNPTFFQRIQNEVVRRATSRLYSYDPPLLNKFALIKWRRGLSFRRAPHCVNQKMKVSEGLAAFLHFKFYKGEEAISYNVRRGQHTAGGVYYKKMLENREKLEKSPLYAGTRMFTDIDSLKDILR